MITRVVGAAGLSVTWKSIVAPPVSLTVAFAGLDASPVIHQSSLTIVPVPAPDAVTASVVSVANVTPVRLTVIVRSGAGVVSPLIGTCRLITVPEGVPAGIGTTALTMPSELVYDQLMSSGVTLVPSEAVTVTGNVIEFAPGESPSGDDDGDALPIETVHVGESA